MKDIQISTNSVNAQNFGTVVRSIRSALQKETQSNHQFRITMTPDQVSVDLGAFGVKEGRLEEIIEAKLP